MQKEEERQNRVLKEIIDNAKELPVESQNLLLILARGIGVPAGVKIHSAVYGVTPVRAGQLLRKFASGGVKEYLPLLLLAR